MNWLSANRRKTAIGLAGTLFTLIAPCADAQAQGRLAAQYSIIMTGVTIGHVTWSIEIGASSYTTTASGKASGMFSVLFSGEGSVGTEGQVENGHLHPLKFDSEMVDEDGRTKLTVTFRDGVATVDTAHRTKPSPERVPVTDAARRGVADPLSAVLIAAQPAENVFSAVNCDHVLSIFDGQRRYDLVLSFLRVDKFSLKQTYDGPVLVCRMILRPIAGYRPSSRLVKYVASRRDMELWLAPIAGTILMAPIRVAMPTIIGTLKFQADKFDTMALPKPAAYPATPATPKQ